MTYDYELVLIKENGFTTSKTGDSIPITTSRVVLCDQKSVTRAEHYAAAAYGLKPEIVFVINKYEYEGEAEVEFDGKLYSVKRTYIPEKSKGIEDFESIELVCQGLVNNNAGT